MRELRPSFPEEGSGDGAGEFPVHGEGMESLSDLHPEIEESMNQLHYDENEGERGRWHGIPDKTTITADWTVLVLDNGNKILTFGDEREAGAQVHVLDFENYEIQMWEVAEWETEGEGELVMGAFLRCAAKRFSVGASGPNGE